MKISDSLRDPVWQFIGAVISLLALAVSLWPTLKLTNNDPNVSLWNSQQFSVFSSDPAPLDARDKLRLLFQGKSIPVTELSVSHFGLTNQTGRVIESSDFAQPLSFKPANGVEVIYVKSIRQEATTALATSWHRTSNESWEMTPTVLNPDETLWIQLVYRVPETIKDKSAANIFQWQALFKGITFKVENPTKSEPHWYYLQIKHEGLGLYLLIACGLILSLISFMIYQSKAPHEKFRHRALIILVVISSLSWAVAEMTVDMLYNQNLNQPVIAWLFLAGLTIIAISAALINQKSLKMQQRDELQINNTDVLQTNRE